MIIIIIIILIKFKKNHYSILIKKIPLYSASLKKELKRTAVRKKKS